MLMNNEQEKWMRDISTMRDSIEEIMMDEPMPVPQEAELMMASESLKDAARYLRRFRAWKPTVLCVRI